MLDRPDAAALLRAMAATLAEEVLPETRGAVQHSVRVIANLCRILERELQGGGAGREETRRSLSQLLGRDAPLDELVRALDQRLAEDANDSDFEARAGRLMFEDVRRRLAIDKPGYDATDAGDAPDGHNGHNG